MRSAPTLALGAGLLAATVAPACSCDDDPVGTGGAGGGATATATTTNTTTTGQASTSTATGQGGDGDGGTGQGGDGGIGQGGFGGFGQGGFGGIGQGGDGGQGGEGGSPPVAICEIVASSPTRGSAIGISGDDSTLVSVNRDLDTVTITRVDYTDPVPAMTKLTELTVGLEPWQVAVNACGNRAYAVSRADQRVVEIVDLETDDPAVGESVAVGSEPTGIAISPFNTRLYVSNWVEGTVTVIDTEDMSIVDTIDLNQALVDTGYLGTVTSRVGLAHPRAIAITNDGDEDDSNEKIVVTEWFAQRVAPEADNGLNSDVNKEGLVYVIDAATGAVEVINLPAIANVGINNRNNQPTGCFPNQIGSVTISGDFAYVTSTCASPVGPIGVNVPAPPIACTVATQATDCPANTTAATCNATTLVCNPNTQDAKTTTHPALHIVDLAAGTSSAGEALDTRFSVDVGSARMPLLPTDIGFFNDFAYLTGMGADAAFRVEVDGDTIVSVGSDDNDFIDLRNGAADTTIRLPIGIATANGNGAFAFVANDGSRDVTALALASQSIAGAPDAAAILQAADLPTDAADVAVLRGKRFFNTGLGRWSLAGAAWGACAACHIDGLTDNVTWYFARGPRQSVSLDGSFNSADPDDQRIFNWTGIFDEVADFEGNVRGISGGLGAIVDSTNARLNTAAGNPPQQGLQGSSRAFADPAGPSASVLEDWNEIEDWVKTIRSPKAPVGLDDGLVADGREIFTDPAIGNCIGCHSGGKWTISKIFYTQGDVANAATGTFPAGSLEGTSWNVALNNFPAALLPADAAAIAAGNDRMRLGVFPASEQIQCILRPVGTMQVNKTGVVGTSPAAVNVRELRQNMTSIGQGLETTGRGFNPPSLLGLQVGAPFYHGGNARTLEEAFDDIFAGHHQSAIASVFDPDPDQKAALVQFLLSIDESTLIESVPAKGDAGGDICFTPP